MLQEEHALNNLGGLCIPRDLHVGLVLANNRLLFGEVAHTLEDELRTTRSNLHTFTVTEAIHVAANLLEVAGWETNDGREVQTRNLDLLDIRVENLETVICRRRLVRILDANTQLVRVVRW